MLKASIPFVDLRGKTPIDLLRAWPDRAQALVEASRRTFGWASYAASAAFLPWADKRSHAWLKRSRNPYLHEIETFADVLRTRGMYALNVSYEWGCTSGAYAGGDGVALLRTLDWPFPALGQQVMVVLQSGKRGDFYNVTWPGVAGVFTAMAPGRFSAALNMAPMRRHGLTYPGDWIKNRLLIDREPGLPPAHLLRQAFEQADTYDTARHMLATTPVAAPVIFILAGARPGEGCVIERLENACEIFDLGAQQRVCSANHFQSRFDLFGHGWRPRQVDSAGRLRQACALHGHELDIERLQSPMINYLTRLAVLADAESGHLAVQGLEGAIAATNLFTLPNTVQNDRQVAQ